MCMHLLQVMNLDLKAEGAVEGLGDIGKGKSEIQVMLVGGVGLLLGTSGSHFSP